MTSKFFSAELLTDPMKRLCLCYNKNSPCKNLTSRGQSCLRHKRVTVNRTGRGFDLIQGNGNIYCFHFLTMVSRQSIAVGSAILNASPQKFGRNCRAKCPSTRLSLSTLLHTKNNKKTKNLDDFKMLVVT